MSLFCKRCEKGFRGFKALERLAAHEAKCVRQPLPAATCCYAGCGKPPSFSLWLAFKAEHGGERRVPICAEHAAFLTLNDSFVPAATFAGQDVADTGPWADFGDA